MSGWAADLPKEQPKYITIVRESVKPGRAADHAKHEAGWPAAFEKAKSPDYYLAMTSLTGSPEAWYVSTWESHAALGESMKREAKDEALSKQLERLAAGDAEFIDGLRIIQARARTDLSRGKFPDLAKARFFTISVIRMRPGHSSLFEEAAKAYGAAAEREDPKAGYRVYEVTAGMSGPTFLIFSSVESFGEFDQRMAADEAVWKGCNEEEKATLKKFSAEGVLEAEKNRYRLDPVQSYVSKETRDTDPDFWKGK